MSGHSGQQLLIPAPSTPAEWCASWGIPLLEEIPHPGLATAKDLAALDPSLRRWPGRNHPRAGQWLRARYSSWNSTCADPMYGAGCLWIGDPPRRVIGADIEIASPRSQGNARTWAPPCGSLVDLVLFSPPFLQNHSAGATEHQQEIREAKGLHTMQEFGVTVGNLGRLKAPDFWLGMADVYRQVLTYTKAAGRMVVILRNYIRRGQEVDEIGDHLALMREASWEIEGAHPRALRPTGYQQWKVARDPSTPWIRTEWAIVAMPQVPW